MAIQNAATEVASIESAVSGNTGGPSCALGTEIRMPASELDRILYYVDASDDVVPGSSSSMFIPAATHTAVYAYKNCGDLVWIYVYNPSDTVDLERGEPLQHSAGTGYYHVRQALAGCPPGMVVGVPQHDIPPESYGWIVRQGKCYVKADGSVAADDGLIVSGTAGQATVVAAATGSTFGWSLEADAGAASEVLGLVFCRG